MGVTGLSGEIVHAQTEVNTFKLVKKIYKIVPRVCSRRCCLPFGRQWRRRVRRRAEPPSSPQFLSAPPASSPAATPSVRSSAALPEWPPSASSAAHRAPAEPAGHQNVRVKHLPG